MELQALTLRITEQDLNDMAARRMPADSPIENLRFRLAPEGLYVSGEYPLFLKVSFETTWELGVRNGDVTARLAHLKALGLPVAVFKSVLVKLIADAAKKDWLRMDDETVIIQVDRLLQSEGVPLKTNLTAIRCQAQSMIVEAKAAPAP